MNRYVILYLVAINIITFIIYGIDKYKSQHQRWRIKEATLILLSVIGGSIGALLAMMFFRHKTKHAKFYIGVPLILILQIVAVIFLH